MIGCLQWVVYVYQLVLSDSIDFAITVIVNLLLWESQNWNFAQHYLRMLNFHMSDPSKDKC